MRIHLKAAVLAVLCVLGAMPAAASTFVFDVTVTGVGDVDYGPINVTRYDGGALPPVFRLTYSTSGPFTIEVLRPGYGSAAGESATASASAIETQLLAVAGLAAPSGTSASLTRYGPSWGPGYALQDEVLFDSSNQVFGGSPTTYSERYFDISIYGFAPGAPDRDTAPYDDHAIDEVLRRIDTLSFYAEGHYLSTSRNGEHGQVDEAYYVGTAVYRPDLGGVPEPDAWVLMIGGLGLAGMALRRRRASGAVAI